MFGIALYYPKKIFKLIPILYDFLLTKKLNFD